MAISCRPKARGWQRSACRFAETLDEALSFVRVLCVGMSAFDCSSRVVQHDTDSPVLVVQTNGKLFGDFATRSRIPFNVISGSFAVVSSRIRRSLDSSIIMFRQWETILSTGHMKKTTGVV